MLHSPHPTGTVPFKQKTDQTCIPILFNMLPEGIIVFSMFVKAPIGNGTHYCAMLLCFAQILDPLLTMLIIVEYKQFILKVFRMVVSFRISRKHLFQQKERIIDATRRATSTISSVNTTTHV